MAREKTLFALILVAALAARLLAGVWWQARLPADQRFAFPDSATYWALAQTIVRAEPYQYGEDGRIFRTPGYPALLATLFWLAGSEDPPVMWGRAASAVLGTCTVAGVWILGRQLFDSRTALVSAGIAALFPEAIAPGTFVLSEAPFCPLLVAHLACWTAAWRSPHLWSSLTWAGIGGLVAGAATLMRPSWLLFTPFALAIALAVDTQRRRHLLLGVAMLLGFALAMTPWWIRNQRVERHFVMTTLQVGASLYDGLNPKATGASDMRFVTEFTREQRQYDSDHPDRATGSFEARLDRRLRDAAVVWAREHPGRFAQLVAIKFLRMWNVWPNEAGFRAVWIRLLTAMAFIPLLIGALWGAARWARQGWPYVLCVLPAIYFTALHVVFVSSIRYRQPALFPMFVLAAAVLCRRYPPSKSLSAND